VFAAWNEASPPPGSKSFWFFFQKEPLSSCSFFEFAAKNTIEGLLLGPIAPPGHRQLT
jgi:hypothetical protein